MECLAHLKSYSFRRRPRALSVQIEGRKLLREVVVADKLINCII
jgi:hypothetical protein